MHVKMLCKYKSLCKYLSLHQIPIIVDDSSKYASPKGLKKNFHIKSSWPAEGRKNNS